MVKKKKKNKPLHPPPPEPYEPNTTIQDQTISKSLIGTPIYKQFPKTNKNGSLSKSQKEWHEGTVTGYTVTDEGDCLHQVTYSDNDYEELTFREIQIYHHKFLVNNCITSVDLNLSDPSIQKPLSPDPIQPELEHTEIPVPSSLKSYPLRITIDDKYVPATIQSRTIDSNHTIHWNIQFTENGQSVSKQFPNDSVLKIISKLRHCTTPLHKPTNPTPKSHSFRLPTGLSPLYWGTNHHTIGTIGDIKLHKHNPSSTNRTSNETITTTFITYAKNIPSPHSPDQYIVRILGENEDEFALLDDQQLSDGIFAHSNNYNPKKPGATRRIHNKKPDQSEYHALLCNLAEKFPDDPKGFYRSAFVTSKNSIPQQCINLYRDCLLPISKMTAANDPTGWKLLCIFNGLILAPQPSGKKWSHTVRNRLKLFSHAEWDQLLNGDQQLPVYKSRTKTPTTPPNPLDDRDQRALQAQTALLSSKSITMAIKSLSPKAQLTATTEQIISKLKSLHPQPGDPIPLTDTEPESYKKTRSHTQVPPTNHISDPQTFSFSDYQRTIYKSDGGSGAGPCGTNFRHLRIMFCNEDQLSNNLTKSFNLIAMNKLDKISRVLLTTARIVAVPKNKPGDIRPIAVGSCIVRIVSRTNLLRCKGKMNSFFLPNQFGIGIQSGTEIMVQTIITYLKKYPKHVALHADALNAFNSWDRNVLWETLHENFPELSNIIRFSYESPTSILLQENPNDPTEIMSSVGSRQGCTFGSFTFSLAMHSILLQLQHEFQDCLIIAYCDDLWIMGNGTSASDAYKRWKILYNQHMEGSLRNDKGKCFSPELSEIQIREAGLPRDIPFSNEGTTALGTPIGKEKFIHDELKKVVDKAIDDVHTILRMPSIQAQHCLIIRGICPRLLHHWRIIPTVNICTLNSRSNLREVFHPFDDVLRKYAQSLSKHHKISNDAWTVATLPSNLGGLGLTTWEDTKDPAFLASYSVTNRAISHLFPTLSNALQPPTHQPIHNSHPISMAAHLSYRRLNHLNPSISNLLKDFDPSTFTHPIRHLQHKLTNLVSKTRHQQLLNRSTPRNKAQLLSNQNGGSFFSINPSSSALQVSNSHFTLTASRFMLMKITKCPCIKSFCCVCHKESDSFGDHALLCYHGGNPCRKYLWHDLVVRTIGSFHNALGIPYTIEPRDLVPGRNKRPDINVHYLDETISYDVKTCVSTRNVTASSSQQGHEAETGACLKEKTWSYFTEIMDVPVIPLTIEDGGYMHKNISAMLRRAINSKTEPDSRMDNVTLAYWKQRLLVTNMKGVAMSILAQHPTCRNPSCIHRIETHRYSLLPIGSNASHTSNSYLHYPNDIQQPTSTTQQPSSNTSTTDSIPMPTGNPSLTQLRSNPSDSTTYSGCLSHSLPNDSNQYSNYHTNPTSLPMVSSLSTSPNIAVYPTNGPTSLWSQPTLFDNIWNYEPPTTFDESNRNHTFQGRAISCIFDQPLS